MDALKVGDVVVYTNSNGVKFYPRKVVGFRENPDPDFMPDNTVYIDGNAPWFPVRPGQLKKISLDGLTRASDVSSQRRLEEYNRITHGM